MPVAIPTVGKLNTLIEMSGFLISVSFSEVASASGPPLWSLIAKVQSPPETSENTTNGLQNHPIYPDLHPFKGCFEGFCTGFEALLHDC
jgi:hypothetical protein